MWIIIWTICLVVTYNTVYSLILLAFSNDDCYVLSDSYIWVHSLSTVMQRSIQYIWWLYPLLWLFWPGELSCGRGKAGQKSVSEAKGQKDGKGAEKRKGKSAGVKSGEVKDVGSSDEEDEDEYGNSSSNSFINLQAQSAGTAMFGGAVAGPGS